MGSDAAIPSAAGCCGGCMYSFARGTMISALSVFFSNGVEVVNEGNVPRDGPVIFVANHMSQFVDSMVMLKSVRPRKVSFIVAEKSMHRVGIGHFARMLNAVPVIRPQDRAKAGQGAVRSIDLDARLITVVAGKLTTDCAQQGCSIAVKGVGTFVVAEVLSDTEAVYRPLDEEALAELDMSKFEQGGPLPFKVVPKIPQNEVFEAVFERLRGGGSIGIFPEGGSHDNTSLLPLKAGVAVMALGARARGIPVNVVCLGFNYLAGHHFRSKCFVDVAPALEPEQRLVDAFAAGGPGKIAAGKELLEQINARLQSVLVLAPTYSDLKAMRTARRLYQNNSKLSSAQYVALSVRFSQGYNLWKDLPEFQDLLHDIHVYNKFAWAQGLSDKDVAELPPLGSCPTLGRAWAQLSLTVLLFIVVTPLILPGLVLSAPIQLRTRCVVKREMRKALAGSSVKVAARDVAASQKVLTAALMIPLAMFLYTVAGLIALWFVWPYKDRSTGAWHDFVVSSAWWLIPLFFLVLFPMYVFYVTVALAELLIRRARHLPIAWTAIASVCKRRHRNPAHMLRQDRKRLVLRVQQFVQTQGMDLVPGWREDPIISPAELADRRSQDTLALMEAGDLRPSLSGPGEGVRKASSKTLRSNNKVGPSTK